MEFIKEFLYSSDFAKLLVGGLGALFLPFIKPIVDKFTQSFYPTSKSVEIIRDIQLKEVYLPLHQKFRKFTKVSKNKLELLTCRELYIKTNSKAAKYYVYIEDGIIDCIKELGDAIKQHDMDNETKEYKKISKKLLRSINIQYSHLKKNLSYTTGVSLWNFRSLDPLEQFYKAASFLYVASVIGLAIGLLLMRADQSNNALALISFFLLVISGSVMIICVAIIIFELLYLLCKRFMRRR